MFGQLLLITLVAISSAFQNVGFGCELKEVMEISREFGKVLQNEEFIDVDENVHCFCELTDPEMYEQVEDSIQKPIVEVNSVEIDNFPDAPSSYDALQMIRKLRKMGILFRKMETRMPM